MKKKLIVLCLVLFSIGCKQNPVEKMLYGMWTISYIDDGIVEENQRECLNQNVLTFYENGTCELPIYRENCYLDEFHLGEKDYEIVNWSITNIDGCYFITFNSPQKIFAGPLNLLFKRDRENKLLQLLVFSNSVYFSANKILMNYDQCIDEIIKAEKMTTESCRYL